MSLVDEVRSVRDSSIEKIIEDRLKEFSNITSEELFEELCFCLMTANFRAKKCIEIQEAFGREAFHNWSEEKLARELKNMGHRFWPQRATRIVLAREFKDDLRGIRDLDTGSARKFLVENISGLGLKESSHFLRNVGMWDYNIAFLF